METFLGFTYLDLFACKKSVWTNAIIQGHKDQAVISSHNEVRAVLVRIGKTIKTSTLKPHKDRPSGLITRGCVDIEK